MASEIRVDKINSLSGVGTVTLSPTGVDISGITTAATLRATTGIVTSLTAVSSAKVGSGVTLSPDGDIFATGVTTATTFVGALTGNVTGNATGLSGTPNISAGTIAGSTGTFTGDVDIADKIVHTGDTNTAIRFPAADTFTVETAGDERVRITSTGLFGIGTTPEEIFHVKGPSETVSSRDGVFFQHNTDSDAADTGLPLVWSGRISSGLANYGLASICGRKENSTGGDGASYLQFATCNSAGSLAERLRIDSSGNFIVGGTSLGAADSFGVQSTGHFRHVGASGATGDTLLGAIDGVSNGFQVNISGTNVQKYKFHNGSTQTVQIDSDGLKFMNDTAAANALDDYEEGSWTPVFQNVNAPTYSTQYGRYCKNGSLVQLTGQITVSSGLDTSDGSTVNIGGFPYAGNSNANAALFTFGRYTNLIPNAKLDDFTNARFNGDSIMLLEGNDQDISYAECNSSGTLQFAISYIMNT